MRSGCKSAFIRIQDVHVFEQSDIDDYTLTESGNVAANNLEAADAYLDQSTYQACHVMVKLEITQPGESGGSDWESIQIRLKVQKPAGTDLDETACSIFYDETSSDKIYAEIYCLNFDGNDPPIADTPARIRVDWHNHSGSYPPSSVKVTIIKLWNFG